MTVCVVALIVIQAKLITPQINGGLCYKNLISIEYSFEKFQRCMQL